MKKKLFSYLNSIVGHLTYPLKKSQKTHLVTNLFIVGAWGERLVITQNAFAREVFGRHEPLVDLKVTR